MLELIYPSTPAPLYKGSSRVDASEMLPVVDINGVVSHQASREYCHDGSKVLHPVVHLHIINRMGEIFLQQRSALKELLPLKWDTAVGGHTGYGELVLESLYREASEELNFRDFNPYWITSYEFESKRERELVNVFATVGNFSLDPHNDEVLQGRYWSEKEILKNMGKGVFTPNFELEYEKIKDKLYALL